MSGQLAAAVTAMDRALPDLGHAYTGSGTPRSKRPRALVPLYRADWSSTNPVDWMDPPGGAVEQGETYGGVALGRVNDRDDMKMVLDMGFTRVEQSGIPVDADRLLIDPPRAPPPRERSASDACRQMGTSAPATSAACS